MAPADRAVATRDLSGLMGCSATVTVVGGGPALLDLAESELRTLETLWSRFLPDSEIGLLNLTAGRAVPVSARTRLLVRRMVEAHRATDGAFDPTLLLDLVALGYGTSRIDASRTTLLRPGTAPRGSVDGIVVDDARDLVLLPEGTAVDPGGLGKGLAADLVVETLLAHGAAGALIGIGGDLRVAGRPPRRAAWTIDVEDPHQPDRALHRLHVADGGIATSSVLTNTWTGPHGADVHHVLDPATGEPARSDLVAATVVAGTGAWAEALSTACLVLGSQRALDLLGDHGVGGLLVRRDRTVVRTPAWSEFAA
jgi:thiamine biosynthesis lipoprotein